MRNVVANSLWMLGCIFVLFGCAEDSSMVIRNTNLKVAENLNFNEEQLDFWKNGKLPSVAEVVEEKQSSLLIVRRYSSGNLIYLDDETYWKLSVGFAELPLEQNGASRISNAVLAKGASAFPRNMCVGIVTEGTLKKSGSADSSVTYEIVIKSTDMRMISNTAECQPEDIQLSGVARSTDLIALSEWQRNMAPDGTTLGQTYP